MPQAGFHIQSEIESGGSCEEKKQEESEDESPVSQPTLGQTSELGGPGINIITGNKMVEEILQALSGLVHVTRQQAKAVSTATYLQLHAVFGDHSRWQDILAAVALVQKKHGVYINPTDNWFTQNIRKFGRGFDMKQLKDPARLAAKFDRLSENYDHWTVGNQSRVESFIVQCAKKNEMIIFDNEACDDVDKPSKTRKAKVLDVACGIGLQGQVLRLMDFEGQIYGCDISPGMIQRVWDRGCYDCAFIADANGLLPALSKAEGGGGLLPLFDVVICTGAMELLEDKQSVLAGIAKVTKPGGELWVSFQHDTTRKLGQQVSATEHQSVKGITQDAVVALLSEAGFGQLLSMDVSPNAFYTPSPAQDGTLLPVPYLFLVAKKDEGGAV
jgi:predicted TPR repeat methyltransferase